MLTSARAFCLQSASAPAAPCTTPRRVFTVFEANPAKRHEIVCGAGLLDEIPARLAALLPKRGKTVVITDTNVRALHGDTLLAAFAREGSCEPLLKVRFDGRGADAALLTAPRGSR